MVEVERQPWYKRHQGYLVLTIVLIFAVPLYFYNQRQQEHKFHQSLNAIYVSQLASCGRGQGIRKAVADIATGVGVLQDITKIFLQTATQARQSAVDDPSSSDTARIANAIAVKVYLKQTKRIHKITIPSIKVICKEAVPDPNHLVKLVSSGHMEGAKP